MTYENYTRAAVLSWFAIIGSVALLGLTACGGGPPRVTRVAVEQLGEGLNVADEAVAEEIARRGPETREQIRQEAAEGMIADVAAGLERFEELMEPTTEARTVLRVARASLVAVEGALDAWTEGSSPEANFLTIVACAVSPLTAVVPILEALDVEAPEAFTQGLRVVAALATGVCPQPENN